MTYGARMRIAWALALAGGVAMACNAIVGVEDVRLAKRDAGEAPDDEDAEPEDAGPPLDASGIPEAEVALALGFNHTCARTNDGTVRCWGDNGAGQVGDGVPFEAGSRPPVLSPQKVVDVDDAVAVGAGLSHSCAVHASGAVSCWGVNTFGQLGDGTTARSSRPVSVIGVSDAVAVTGGTSFTCARLRSGGAACWGANYSGQLGDGTKVDRARAAPVEGLSGVVDLAAAEHHACAVVSDGTVKCWGKNDDGQLGDGTLVESLTPRVVPSLHDIVAVAAASRFTCARQATGKVFCWGSNEIGQLGNGSPNDAPNPSPLLTSVADAIDLYTGWDHACAVRATGAVVCWGAAGDGQIGSGSVPPDASIAVPTEVVGVSGALAVATGGNHSCATTRSGAVYCWGSNALGQLGDGTKNRAYAAVRIPGFP